MRPVRNTVPVNIIADGRPALVVGFGSVGKRKVKFLEDCGVKAEVIAPEVNRRFCAGDCAGKLMVFACTDDKHVNRAVLEDARSCGVPCCCADLNWADSDFTTPAVVRSRGATVAVSTNGASCVGAKDLRRSLEFFLESRGAGRVTIVGTSDRYMPPEKRAKFHLTGEARREMAGFLREIKGVDGLVALNTCNRVEVVLHGDVNLGIVKRLMHFHHLADDEYFILENDDAFRHMVMVASGLESAWAGEFHVVSQVKEAVEESVEAGMIDGRLKGFFDDVLRVAKDVRHAVEGMLEVSEVETAAVKCLASRLNLDKARIVVMGAGKAGTAVAAALAGKNVTVIHHDDEIPPCDALVCAMSSPEPVLRSPIEGCVVVDLGMPPNCAPSVGAVSLDELKNFHRSETGALAKAVSEAERIIAEHISSVK